MSELTNHPTSIKILPEHIIDQIKAGEVIERPSALIKELIENSLDAEASKIDISLIDNGMSLIALEDNGKGMAFEDVPYAFLRHATSKIEKFEDLYHLHSFGFRGEALASIAAISRVTCITSPKNKKRKGAKLILNAGVEELLIPQELEEHGTKLFIKDLFFNTPARLKFIKSKSSEKIALKKIFQAFLLSNPEVEFSIKWDDDDKDIYRPKYDNLLDNEKWRVAEIFYNKKEKKEQYLNDLVRVENEFEKYRIHGYFSHLASPGSAHKQHFLFINNRLFFDKTLHQGIVRNLERFWPTGSTGHYVFFIDVPPEEIDVNVHPNKTQIKFFKPDVVYTLIMGGIKESLHRLQKEKGQPTGSQASSPTLIQLIDQDEQKNLKLQSFNTFDDSAHSFLDSADLKESTRPTHEFNSSEIYHHQRLDHTDAPTFFIPHIHFEDWLLFKEKDSLWCVDRVKLFYFQLFNDFLDLSHQEEVTLTPLLISEPIKLEPLGIKSLGADDKLLNFLKHYGLECDFLDRDYLALRSVPEELSASFGVILTKVLILLFHHKKNEKHFHEWLTIKDELLPLEHDLKALSRKNSPQTEIAQLQKLGMVKTLENKIILKITNEALTGLLNKK